jgi:hypothetical protein
MRRLLSHATVTLLLAVATPALGQAPYETEPTLPTARLVGGSVALSGPGYRMEPTTRVEMFMGRFVLRTKAGQVDAIGMEELEERVAEVPALEKLMAMQRSDVFADALKSSTRRTVDAATRVVTQPGETVAALPRGIGNAIRAQGRKVRSLAMGVADAVAREREKPEPEAETPANDANGQDELPDFARELAGVNKARRQIAAKLGIDPYTRSPRVADKLESLAWASVAGGISVDVALSAIPGELRDALAFSRNVDQLAWSQPPADIRRLLESRLRARGHEGRLAREMLRNRSFTPTQQVSLVELLEQVNVTTNEALVLEIATDVQRPGEARFLLAQLRMLALATDPRSRGAYGGSGGVVWLELKNGSHVLPLPLDYLSWTPTLGAGMPASLRPDARRGSLLISGQASPQARERLQALGWQVKERQRLR